MFHIKILVNLDVSILKIYQFIRLNNTYAGNVKVCRGEYIVNGKSLLGVLSLDLSEKATIELTGKYEPEYLKRLDELGISYNIIT